MKNLLFIFLFCICCYQTQAQERIIDYFISDTKLSYDSSQRCFKIISRTTQDTEMVSFRVDSIKIIKKNILIYCYTTEQEIKLFDILNDKPGENTPNDYCFIKDKQIRITKIGNAILFKIANKFYRKYKFLVTSESRAPALFDIVLNDDW